MNSISLTSYDIKSGDYERLRHTLGEQGFIIEETGTTALIKDKGDDFFSYGLIHKHTKLVLLDNRSKKDLEFEVRRADLKDLLDEF